MKKNQPQISLVNKRARKNYLRRKYHKYNLQNFYRRDDLFHSLILHDKPPNESMFVTKHAPDIFSILVNRSETIGYLNAIDGMLEQHTHTRIDCTKVKYTDLPTICVLTALLETKYKSSPWEVKIPKSSQPNGRIWYEAQFDRMILRERRLYFSSGSFLSRSSKIINSKIIGTILNNTLRYFGEGKKQSVNELSPVINEIVENTTWHADPQNLSSVPWIINTRVTGTSEVKEMEYCIVDLGVGMHESIKENVAKYNTTAAKALHRLSAVFDEVQSQSSFLSKNIPGGIGSRTNQETRGKGVRHVHQVAGSDVYTEFVIITNKARVNLKDLADIEEDSESNFSGTVYYWKIKINE